MRCPSQRPFSREISLELFLAQYHVWLANDTRALLVLVPGWPMLNTALVAVVFVAVARTLAHSLDAIGAAAARSPAVRGACVGAVLTTVLFA